jgi:hypothetical protein
VTATWLADALRAQPGLKVVEHDGWKTRSRPFTFDGSFGVLFHHTASNRAGGNEPSLGSCINGRPDLPGPLCHVMIGRDGTAHVIAAGYANHAGFGGPLWNVPKDSGNKYLMGVEVENDGLDEPWTDTVIAACDRVFEAILKHLGRGANRCAGHKEWAPTRKIDPNHSFDMDAYRTRLAGSMEGKAVSAEEEDEMDWRVYASTWDKCVDELAKGQASFFNWTTSSFGAVKMGTDKAEDNDKAQATRRAAIADFIAINGLTAP